MRVLVAQLAPVPGDLESNLGRVQSVVRDHAADTYVFPELFLSGYCIGDQFHRIALEPAGVAIHRLQAIAQGRGATIIVGAPMRHSRAGEVENAAVIVGPDGAVEIRSKRFLPTYGPFMEGAVFTPSSTSSTVVVGGHLLGVQICYDAFFPEVSRELALQGAELLVVLSAAPVTSRRLFDKVLPARAVENAIPLVYVNRVGVEDGIVFGGGSQSFDARGELLDPPSVRARSDEAVWSVELDLREAALWRPFRPVLRDISARRTSGPATPSEDPIPAVRE